MANLGDSGVAATQQFLARATQAAAARDLVDEAAVDPKASAAFRSAGGPGSGVWSHAAVLPNQHLTDKQFVIAARTRLHLPLAQCSGRCQHRKRDGSICGAVLDPHGFHSRC